MATEDLERGGLAKRSRSNDHHYDGSETTQWSSWLVPMIIVANIVVFFLVMFFNDCPSHRSNCFAPILGKFSFEPLRDNPLFGPSSSTLKKLGALEWTKIVKKHQAWRLITCIWLHAGLIHLLVSILSLVLVGTRLEHRFGFVRIGVIYLFSGFGGSVLSSLFIRNNISVGASGALFGLFGSMLSELFTNWTIHKNKVTALFTLLVIVIINIAVGILPYVNNYAHIGGFLAGFLLGLILLPRPQFRWVEQQNFPAEVPTKSKYKAHQYVLWIIALVLLVSGVVVALVKLLRGENMNEKCKWCHYLSCIPTSRWDCV